MKQTAVDWLMQQLKNIDITHKEVFEQAKVMEKVHIIEAWNTRAKINDVLTFTDNRTAEQYYTETYESNN